MKKLMNSAYMLTGLILCALAAVCLLFSPRKLTYLEYRMSFDIHPVTVDWQGQKAEALSAADENGKPFYEILDNITVQIEPGRPIPVAAHLIDGSGKVLCGLGADIIADASGTAESGPETGNGAGASKGDAPAFSAVLFHIPFLKRPAEPEKCSVLFLDAAGNPFDLSNINNYSWYGGSSERFWAGLCVFGIVYFVIFLLRGAYLILKKRYVQEDALAMAMVVAALSFGVLSFLASEFNPTIMDENDNIIGGMLQTGGGFVLYRDYVSQHTPFVYWLCALFTKLGAKSFGQFRLLFHILISFIWGAAFFRHRNRKFVRAIVLFSVFFGPVSYLFIGVNAGQILSDNVQAVAMTVLFLEMLAYYEDHRIGAGRAAVISLCIFAAVGSAFLAVYSIFACMAAVILEEIVFFRKHPEKISFFIGRYSMLFICVLLPWVAAIAYLGVNGALKDAFDMAFRFNLEVYPKYGMPGRNFLEPFYSGIINIVKLVRETWTGFAAGEVLYVRAVESAMIIGTGLLLIVAIFRHGLIWTLGIFFFIETQATRQAVQFHSIMLWSVVLMFLLAELPGMSAQIFRRKTAADIFSNQTVPGPAATDEAADEGGPGKYKRTFSLIMPAVYTLVLLLVFGLSYAELALNVIRYRIDPVPPTEMSAVNDTENGEKIFLDAGVLTTDYLFYKERYPVTRLCWMLPWYYEWYGEETVRALREEKPKVAVYKMNVEVWGVSGFAEETEEILRKEYVRVGALDLYERKAGR